MPTRHHSTAAPRLGFIATAAALAALAAVAFLLLRPGAGNAAQSSGAMVSTAKTSLGRILVNSSGRTLYLFGKDKNGKSSCSGMCASFWPPSDHNRQASRRDRCQGVPARDDEARRRTRAGDLQPSPAVHVQEGHEEGPDERRGSKRLRRHVVRGLAGRSPGREEQRRRRRLLARPHPSERTPGDASASPGTRWSFVTSRLAPRPRAGFRSRTSRRVAPR